jgi:hypothetical protein
MRRRREISLAELWGAMVDGEDAFSSSKLRGWVEAFWREEREEKQEKEKAAKKEKVLCKKNILTSKID